MKKMIDLHMHIIPDVDDGSLNLEMSEQMLRMAISQGVEVVFATSHSSAHEKFTEYTRAQYRKLQKLIKDKGLPVQVCLGCEMLYDINCADQVLTNLESGRIPSLNGTRYVLTEFTEGLSSQMLPYIKKMLENNWIPVISHAERVSDLTIELIKEMKEAGCLVQINAYSVAEEKKEATREKALLLLGNRLVDFVGSDAHSLAHRPPAIEKGIQYLYEHYEETYVNDILYHNAERLLLQELEDAEIEESNIWIDGVMGVITGDALGMPVQFLDREDVKASPIFTMDGFGTYDMPVGTWSDDSSMTLATLASLVEKKQVDFDDIMQRFYRWAANGEYTPAGIPFDQGNTCMEAICNFVRDMDYRSCGKTGEWANGNGALMRIMPICLYAYNQIKRRPKPYDKMIEYVHQVSALTHGHPRSIMACGIYFFLVHAILEYSGTLQEKMQIGITHAKRFYACDSSNLKEWARFKRLENLAEFSLLPEEEIRSSGYVVDSLEAAIWSLITTDSLEEGLLRAVNLGDDTDTVGAIAGGLAGLHYGYRNIPAQWRKTIIKKEEIIGLCRQANELF